MGDGGCNAGITPAKRYTYIYTHVILILARAPVVDTTGARRSQARISIYLRNYHKHEGDGKKEKIEVKKRGSKSTKLCKTELERVDSVRTKGGMESRRVARETWEW